MYKKLTKNLKVFHRTGPKWQNVTNNPYKVIKTVCDKFSFQNISTNVWSRNYRGQKFCDAKTDFFPDYDQVPHLQRNVQYFKKRNKNVAATVTKHT